LPFQENIITYQIQNPVIYPNISIIVAIAQNFAIGKNNDLLFHLPDDLKRFKKITSGKAVIMGKRPFFRA
jgi:dihydrofolate reductase (EC 1.5.1.3)